MGIEESGSYAYASDEGLAKYGKDCPFDVKNYKYTLQVNGDEYVQTEVMGNKTLTIRFKLDQETVHCVPNLTMLVTRTGPNKLMTIMKFPNGVIQEWERTFTAEGMIMCCKNRKNGNTCKITYKRYSDCSGEFRPIAHSGFEEFGKFLGVQRELVNKVINDFTGRLVIQENEGSHHHVYKSTVMPMDLNFVVGKEFEYKNPICSHDVLKAIAEKHDNTLIISAKGAKHDSVTKLVVSPNFLVKEVALVGTNLKYKSIFVRC